jgi:adenosylhomocysteine nucleosidase
MQARPYTVEDVAGVRILYVMATRHEYTRSLAAAIAPLITGVGPVEGGVALSAVLGALGSAGQLPDLVVTLGSAGSNKLEHAGIYQASSVSYRDMDCTALGFRRGETPFSTEPSVFQLGPAIPGLRQATLSSGANIVSHAAYDAIDADMVDMETYAYARAGRFFDRPLIALRGISDGRTPLSGELRDWTDALGQIGESLASALETLRGVLAHRGRGFLSL